MAIAICACVSRTRFTSTRTHIHENTSTERFEDSVNELKRIGKAEHEPDLDHKLEDRDRERNGKKFPSFSFSSSFHSSFGAQWEINTQIGIYRRGTFTKRNLGRTRARNVVVSIQLQLLHGLATDICAEISIPVQRLIKIISSEIRFERYRFVQLITNATESFKCNSVPLHFSCGCSCNIHITKDCSLGIIRWATIGLYYHWTMEWKNISRMFQYKFVQVFEEPIWANKIWANQKRTNQNSTNGNNN